MWDIPWVSWAQQSWLCPLPTPCALPALSLVAEREAEMTSTSCKHCSATAASSTDPNHRPILDTVKKISLPQTKPAQDGDSEDFNTTPRSQKRWAKIFPLLCAYIHKIRKNSREVSSHYSKSQSQESIPSPLVGKIICVGVVE